MTKPTDPPPTTPEGQVPLEKWPASSVYQKIQEALEDFENGHITEEHLAQFLQELHIKDEEHFLDKMDEYNEDLRLRLQKIDIANRALQVAGIVAVATVDLEKAPGIDAQKKLALNKSLNESLLSIKDLGNAKQVAEGLDKTINRLESKQRELGLEGSGKLQQQISNMRDIAMGLKVDYLGSTRTSLGTGVVLSGPLGEIAGLGFDKLNVEADNDGTKYISGFIATAKQELSSELRATATHVKNRPHLAPSD